MSFNDPTRPMHEDLPPLRGEFDDVCPMDCVWSPELHLCAGTDDELEHIAVLGYN